MTPITYTPAQLKLQIWVYGTLRDNPERHSQGNWLGNAFYTKAPVWQSVRRVRQYISQAIPDEPMTKDAACGATGCVAGWAAVKYAPAGAFLSNGRIYLPKPGVAKPRLPASMTHGANDSDDHYYDYYMDWDAEDIMPYAQRALGYSDDAAHWCFSGARTNEGVLNTMMYLRSHPSATERELAENCPEHELNH